MSGCTPPFYFYSKDFEQLAASRAREAPLIKGSAWAPNLVFQLLGIILLKTAYSTKIGG